jgi:hypothetical protein
MKKVILFVFLLRGWSGSACAQDGFVAQSGSLTYDVFDRNGKSFVNHAVDVTGSPFLSDDWKLGALVVNTNRKFDSVKIRINVLTQEVHVLDKNKNEMALAQGYIREIQLPDAITGKPDGIIFQNGFPPVDEQNTNNFYQVLTRGKLSLLLSTRKVIATQKDEVSGEVRKEYRAYLDYYVYDGKTMQRVKKNTAIIDGKQVKFKTIDDLKKAIDGYNAL